MPAKKMAHTDYVSVSNCEQQQKYHYCIAAAQCCIVISEAYKSERITVLHFTILE